MAQQGGPRTLVEQVHGLLRDRIVYGEVEAGSRLHLARLAKDLGVSVGLVREAVTRLASEELVVANPQQGFSVRVVSVADLEDLTWMRVHLESLALRESMARGDLTWESELVAAHHRLARTPVFSDDGRYNRAWMAAHRDFHAALASACGSPTLLRIRSELWDAAEIYRHLSGSSPGGGQRRPDKEHAAILDAAISGDADQATERLVKHLRLTGQLLSQHAERLAMSEDAHLGSTA
jgi:DNA-binding GntR family transcriptional regulator